MVVPVAEDGVEGAGEVRAAIADQEPDAGEPLVKGEGQIAGLLHCPLASRVSGDAANVDPAGAVLDEHQDIEPFEQHCVGVQEIYGENPGGLSGEELPPAGPARRGAGSMPAACRISHTVDGATARPSLVSSPWIRRYPHSGFSFASRTARQAILRTAGGRPGLRRLLVSYFLPVRLRCQASRVAGVTGKTPVQRRRGISRASAASQARSGGWYRPARRDGAVPRSRAAGPAAARHSSPGPRGTPRRPGLIGSA
jgi:hypothetical protein